MIWRDFAIDELKQHLSRQMARINLEDRIKELNSKLTSLGGSSDSVPNSGGHSRIEDTRINVIVARDELQSNLKEVNWAIERVNRGLSVLDEREQKILNAFYIHRVPGYIDRLTEELFCEKSTVYRIKDEALYKFTVAMYGVAD